MEDPPKHNNNIKKNNRKTLNIGAGAGSFAGIGCFVLFGGAIVTATLVSAAFAFKNTRSRQKQSSSSSPSDGVTSMKEKESKTIHDSSQEEKHNSRTDNDEKVETRDGIEDQDSANANFAVSVLESKDVDTESLVSDETAKPIAEYDVFEEDQIAVEAEETMQYEKGRETAKDEVPALGHNVSEASNDDIPNGHVDEDQETDLTNEEAEAAHVILVKVVQLLKNAKEKDGHSDMEDIMETADHEVAADVHETHEDEVSQTSVSNKPPTQSLNEETVQKVEARVTRDDKLTNNEDKDTEDEIRLLQVIDDQSVERHDNTLARFIDEEETSQNNEQQVTTEDQLINKDEKHTEGKEQHVQVTDDLPPKTGHDAPTQLINKEEKVEEPMVTKDSLVKEDDQTHAQSVKEDGDAKIGTVRSQVTSEGTEKSTQEEPTQEAKSGNQNTEEKTEENKTILSKEQNDSIHNGSGEFTVPSVRKRINDFMLPQVSSRTRWIKLVPIKVNVHAWKVKLYGLPTRFNISRRGIDIETILCPMCGKAVESTSHIFFTCQTSSDILRKISRWWDIDYMEVSSYEEWLDWIVNMRLSVKSKQLFERACNVLW